MPHGIAGGGDAMARGAKAQTFEMPKQCVPGCECATCKPREIVEHDTCICFDSPTSTGTVNNPECPVHLPAMVDNSAILFKDKKPAVTYKGEPLADRVLVKRFVPDSSSAIIIPDVAKGKSDYGVIVNVAPHSKLGFGAGTLVLFDKFAATGQEIMLIDDDGKLAEHLILQECDILLKLTAIHQTEAGTCVQ